MPQTERRELAAQFVPITRLLMQAEEPLLEANGITMWEYVVLNALTAGGAATQLELSGRTGRDKTRLIEHLDRLESAGLLTRRPDPADRRARIIEITDAGRGVVRRCASAIRTMEDALLQQFSAAERDGFRRVLAVLAERAQTRGWPTGTPPGRDAEPGPADAR
ncbi:DNA-binding transcriptional regulator, MarR family [Nakamurella panacisegetis]|uniref:DNA-binding transcriptional regulator, MarR family n=1 Tax=Nakamurella panacisegetis TaxID=1090615 RepID=A0A1H0N276_9ACTN|nr:MarR family transcriptional regulator [Nakamurella panacisegetis]SDO86753.1 DNA-binding transcriptional regulator, MarR family [Nakamurella panacisegetis]